MNDQIFEWAGATPPRIWYHVGPDMAVDIVRSQTRGDRLLLERLGGLLVNGGHKITPFSSTGFWTVIDNDEDKITLRQDDQDLNLNYSDLCNRDPAVFRTSNSPGRVGFIIPLFISSISNDPQIEEMNENILKDALGNTRMANDYARLWVASMSQMLSDSGYSAGTVFRFAIRSQVSPKLIRSFMGGQFENVFDLISPRDLIRIGMEVNRHARLIHGQRISHPVMEAEPPQKNNGTG